MDTGGKKKNSKNLILCFDGTRENFGPQPITNVLKIFQLLEKEDNAIQRCYYQPGIGTEADFDPVVDVRRRFTSSHFRNITDAMFASSVDHHIVSGYIFLMEHYEAGDRIYMFGFSRGAFIARALAGMLERVGLLYRGLTDMVSMAWRIYEMWEYAEQPGQPNYNITLADEFKRTFSRSYDVRVHFQGLFDSVNSVGILRDRLFPCTQRSGIVDHVRHAVSLDERKGKFKQQSFSPFPFSSKTKSDVSHESYSSLSNPCSFNTFSAVSQTDGSLQYFPNSEPSPEGIIQGVSSKPKKNHREQNDQDQKVLELKEPIFLKKVNEFLESEDCHQPIENFADHNRHQRISTSASSASTLTPDLVEKWFPGDHADVGGGWGSDCLSRDSISNISLRWMLNEAVQRGVLFKKGSIHEFSKKSSPIGSLISTIHDKLSFNKGIKVGPLQDNAVTSDENNTNDENGSIVDSGASLFHTVLQRYFTNKKSETITDEEFAREKYSSICSGISKLETFFWWCLEMIPIGLRIENENGFWKNVYVPNLGKSRFVPLDADLHWSIFWRIKFDKMYRPRNLPLYARQILEEFENIDMKTPTLVNLETIASPLKSYPSVSREDQLLLDKNEAINVEIRNTAAAALYARNSKKFIKWESKFWQEIPDDLECALQRDPSL